MRCVDDVCNVYSLLSQPVNGDANISNEEKDESNTFIIITFSESEIRCCIRALFARPHSRHTHTETPHVLHNILFMSKYGN